MTNADNRIDYLRRIAYSPSQFNAFYKCAREVCVPKISSSAWLNSISLAEELGDAVYNGTTFQRSPQLNATYFNFKADDGDDSKIPAGATTIPIGGNIFWSENN